MAAHTTRTVLLAQVRIDGDTQMRASINSETVANYAEAYANGAEMPNIHVVHDGADYWLVDGFHRYHAMRRASIDACKALVTSGTRDDARWIACAANAKHGLPRSNLDKRIAIRKAIELKPGLADREIAAHVGVDHKTVATYRVDPSRQSKSEYPHRATQDDGTTQRPDMAVGTYQDVATPIAATSEQATSREAVADAAPLVPLDAVGRELPALRIEEFQAGRAWANQWLRSCSDLMAQLAHALDGTLGRSAAAARAKAINEQLRYLVREQMMPHAVCPLCNARGCKACHDRGWHTEETWRTVPEELRTPAARPPRKPQATPVAVPADADRF